MFEMTSNAMTAIETRDIFHWTTQIIITKRNMLEIPDLRNTRADQILLTASDQILLTAS